MSQRRAATETIARRYRGQDRAGKSAILGELCATTGWHGDHARKALREGAKIQLVRPWKARPPTCGEDVIVALRMCWAVMGAASGPRMAPFLGELVPVLRGFGELTVDDPTAGEVRVRMAGLAGEIFASLTRSDQRDKRCMYVQGSMLEGRRKSMQPMGGRGWGSITSSCSCSSPPRRGRWNRVGRCRRPRRSS